MQRWTCWKRRDYETVRNYIEHFKNDILKVVSHDIDNQELIWYFWKGSPYFLQYKVPNPQEVGDMDVIFDHAVKVADLELLRVWMRTKMKKPYSKTRSCPFRIVLILFLCLFCLFCLK